MFGNFSLVNLRQQVMSPVAQRENPLSIKLESSKDFKKWLNRLRNHMFHVSNDLAAYAETGNLSQASNEYNLSEQVRSEAINILSFALIELLKISTQGRPHDAIFKETDENPYVTGKEILDMIIKKYDISNFRQDVQIWLPIHSGMVAEHVVQMDNSSDRNLTFCATDTSTSGISKDEWILDSGCTVHVSHNRELFTSFKSSTNSTLRGVGGETHIYGYGDIKIGNVTLKDVAYAPDLPFNLLSVQKAITTSDYALLFDVDHHVKILDQKGYIRALASLKNNLYVVHFGTDTKHIAMGAYDVEITSSLTGSHDPLLASEKPVTPETSILHARLGHPGINSYNQLASIVHAPKIKPASVTVCPTCSLSKGTINKGVISPAEYTSPLQLLQVDLCGPFRYKNYKSEKYFMTIRDAYSRYYSVVHLVKKSDAAQELIDWIQEVENYFFSRGGYKVGAIRTDNGGEFMGQSLHEFFKKKGIQHQLTVPHSSFQNGAVERAHRSIEEKTRCLLVGGRVPPSLWTEAVNTAVYLLNRLPITNKKGSIPFCLWTGSEPSALKLDNLRVFGCAAYATLDSSLRDGKFAPTSISGVFVGYDSNRKAYRIFHPASKKIFASCQVKFDEFVFPLEHTKDTVSTHSFATSTIGGAPTYPSSNSGYRYIESENEVSDSSHGDQSSSVNSSFSESNNIAPDDADYEEEPDLSMRSSSHSSDAATSNLQVVPITAAPPSSPDSTELAKTSNAAVRSSDSYSSFPSSEPYYSAPPSNQSTASISESHLVSHSDIPSCESENHDMVLADPLVDSVTQQLQHSTNQLKSTHDDLMSLQKMNSELTAQNSRLRNHAHHLAQLVPSPTARNKRTHASTDLLPPIVPNEILVDSRPTKQSSTHVLGTDKIARLPTAMVTPDDHTYQTIPIQSTDVAPINHVPVKSAWADRIRHYESKQNWSPTGHSLTNLPIAAVDQLYSTDRAIVVRNDQNQLTQHVLSPDNASLPSSDIDIEEVETHVGMTAVISGHSTITPSLIAPMTMQQALRGKNAKAWRSAAEHELAAFKNHHTYELIPPPDDVRVLGSRWVLTVKGTHTAKARLVAQGHRQIQGLDYTETFAPVVRYDSVRIFLALAACHRLQVHQMDVDTAFLNSPMDEPVYVRQPPAFLDAQHPDWVWKLSGAMYGLKQAPMLWNKHMNGTLCKKGFEQHAGEHGLYFKNTASGIVIVALYVDDLLIAGPNDATISSVKHDLSTVYSMKDLGPVSKFLGLNVHQTPAHISLSLEDYIVKAANASSICLSKPRYIPISPTTDLFDTNSSLLSNITPYQSIVGQLLFAANTGRPDIAHAVSLLSRFLKAPTELHLETAQRVLQYLYTTRHASLMYQMGAPVQMNIYSDASYGAKEDIPYATRGYITQLAGGTITWCSKKIKSTITLSSTEAEYIAASEAVAEMQWLINMMNHMGIKVKTPNLWVDNIPAIHIAENPVHHNRMKHVAIKVHHVRKAIADGQINIGHINTKEQLADITTKTLSKALFIHLRDKIIFKASI